MFSCKLRFASLPRQIGRAYDYHCEPPAHTASRARCYPIAIDSTPLTVMNHMRTYLEVENHLNRTQLGTRGSCISCAQLWVVFTDSRPHHQCSLFGCFNAPLYAVTSWPLGKSPCIPRHYLGLQHTDTLVADLQCCFKCAKPRVHNRTTR